MQPVLITTTTPTKDEAVKIAAGLLDAKLAACVNIIGPVTSMYVWQGSVAREEEYKLFIKSFEEKSEAVKGYIQQNHSYSVPEFSLIRIQDMSESYLAWMKDVL